MERKSNHFSGQLGFVLAAAGSAVGVGILYLYLHLDLPCLHLISQSAAALRKVRSVLMLK